MPTNTAQVNSSRIFSGPFWQIQDIGQAGEHEQDQVPVQEQTALFRFDVDNALSVPFPMGQHRACIGFDLFRKWNKEKVFFVTRMKKMPHTL